MGEGCEELTGWDELPRNLPRLRRLRRLELGSAIAYISHDGGGAAAPATLVSAPCPDLVAAASMPAFACHRVQNAHCIIAQATARLPCWRGADDAADAEAAFAPIGRLRQLEDLAFPCSPLAAVPAVVTQLPRLTRLCLAGGWAEAGRADGARSAVTCMRHGLTLLPRGSQLGCSSRTRCSAVRAGCRPGLHLGSGWREGAFDRLAAATTLRCALL